MTEKTTILELELERLLLLLTVGDLLESASSGTLSKVKKTLEESESKGARGHPRVHSEELILDIQKKVRAEIGRMKESGRKRPGPNAAIRSLIRKAVIDKEGAAGLDRQEARIKKVTSDLFKVYEAGRKRG